MTSNILIQLGFYLIVLLVLAKPLGEFFARVLSGERHFLSPVLGWLERLTYKASGVDPQREMRWTEYAVAVLLFNFFGFLAVYALQRFQGMLPLNPAELGAVSPDSSWNTAVSFATNTNWQGYGGESTMSYLTQMLALAVQNFVSAATGIAVLVALIRGFARKQTGTIGNFWADLTRSTLYILLPLSFVLALALVSQGVVQTFGPYVKAQTVEKIDYEEAKKGPDDKPLMDKDGKPVMEKKSTQEQVLPLGPAASQIAVKQLGTNGGGFFNVNSAHPFENADAAVELPGTALDPADRRGAMHHVRADGRRRAPGLGDPRGDDHHLRRPARGRDRVRAERQPDSGAGGGRHAGERRLSRAATWKGRKPVSASQIRRCGPPRRPPHRTARSTRCTTPSRRSAAWCRCGSCSSAR